MAKSAPKAKPQAQDDATAQAEAASPKVKVISEADLMDAAKAKSPEQAAKAVALFDEYQALGGKLAPGLKRMYAALKKM